MQMGVSVYYPFCEFTPYGIKEEAYCSSMLLLESHWELSRLGLPLFLLPSFVDVCSSDKSSWETRFTFKVVSSRIRSLLCMFLFLFFVFFI